MEDISFFIVRCITKTNNAFYWRICYDRIHYLYPKANIFIIDDNSKIETYTIPTIKTSNTNLKDQLIILPTII